MLHLRSVAAHFVLHLKPTIFRVSHIYLNGVKVVAEKTFETFYSKLPDTEQRAVCGLLGTHSLELTKTATNVELHAAVLEALQEKVKDVARVDTSTVRFNDSIACPLSKLRLITNVLNLSLSVLHDPENDVVYNYDCKHITSRLAGMLGDDLGAWLASNEFHCEFSYTPNTKTKDRLSRGKKGHSTFNLWTEAEWVKGWVPDPKATLPKEVDEFLRFFASPEDKLPILAWLRDCTFDRSEVGLVLCGVPGVGKNIFAQNIAGGLVGVHNKREATRGFKKSAFHSGVANCRVFLLDEAELDPETREILKSYVNGVAAIERKGVDVGDPEQIYASFILANNHKQKIKLQYLDRKFYTPKLCEKNLKEHWSQEKIDEFLELLEQPEYLQQLASYLKFNFKKNASRKFPKNDFFEDVCMNTAPYFFKKFYHQCKHKQRFTAAEFNRGSKTKLDPHELKDEVDIYAAQRGKVLADIEILEDYSWVATSRIYDASTATSGNIEL